METADNTSSPVNQQALETKYRDIADGNVASFVMWPVLTMLETKYRDIADGNFSFSIKTIE